MRDRRALLMLVCVLIAVILLLLFALLRRHNHVTSVVDLSGRVKQYALVGDVLEFRTLTLLTAPPMTSSFRMPTIPAPAPVAKTLRP